MSASDPVRTKPRRAAPPPVRRFSARILTDLAARTKFVDPGLAAAWGQIAGPELAGLCRPGRLTGGGTGRTLEIVARDSAAATRVQFEAEFLRRRSNEFLGPNVVARVVVRQAGERPDDPDGDGPRPGGGLLGRFRRTASG